jgi:type IV secretory pathway component VirB8
MAIIDNAKTSVQQDEAIKESASAKYITPNEKLTSD